jgi:hypothetical protein
VVLASMIRFPSTRKIILVSGPPPNPGWFRVLFVQLPWWLDGDRLRRLAVVDETLGASAVVDRRGAEQAQHTVLARDRDAVLKVYAGIGAAIALIYTARRHTLERLDAGRGRLLPRASHLPRESPGQACLSSRASQVLRLWL